MILTRSYMSLHHNKHTEKEGTPLTRASAAVAAEACFPVQTRTKSLLSRAADFSLTRPQPVNEVLTLFALALSHFRRHLVSPTMSWFVQRDDVASSTTGTDTAMLVKRDTVDGLSVDARNEIFKTKFVEHTSFFGNVDANSFVITDTSYGYVVSANMSVNELTNKETTVDIRCPEFDKDNVCSLVTMTFQKEHGAPQTNAHITMTHTHHTMRADVSNAATIIFRMAVFVTDRDDIVDYEIDESMFGNADTSSGDDADGSGNGAAETSSDDNGASDQSLRFLEEVDDTSDDDEAGSLSDGEHSQPTGPCDMCGAIGPSGIKCEVGPDCDSDAGGTYA